MSSLSIDANQLEIANWKASVTLSEITDNVNSVPTQEASFCTLSGRLETQSSALSTECGNTDIEVSQLANTFPLTSTLPASNRSAESLSANTRRTTDMMLDSHSLQEIKLIDDQDLALRQVAEQFEAIFVQQMLKQMRSASAVIADKDNPLTSQSDSVYQDMLDGQLALNMSQTSGMGIADMLVKQLSRA
ncbi:rod-binding protein [Vibrio sp. B1FLJ16]|uniref:rod-binding protein n=1 Tax=Vibrio sp. B1FLJ16 TaxID=2751178 RepID=UPI0015F51D2F|nr:rod-binding protein [Vibrio sp. B1FLJ16]CAD7811185.1 flagellar protein [Vibrio sp. B1FLJ16]CAD7811971.1 flagellar protein [Vibrio sp. B1FLJ16]CAE6914319.1 flagellar protein [Vibrio sp. B1FLJ16]CAE6917671.1 flagellar protein [Vibrio sp. B1FLJ16]